MRQDPEALGFVSGFYFKGLVTSDPYSVTAAAMASSRHRFRMRKSSAADGRVHSTAISVIDWQTSP